MNKQRPVPTTQLIRLGNAKRCTNAIGGSKPEFDNGPLYAG